MTCGDAKDNDCDGKVDCADGDCAAAACNPNGKTCVSMLCTCAGNGGTAEGMEATCNDGKDNDCDGLPDCADPTCNNKSCGAFGRLCAAGGCACAVSGGAVEMAEATCNDGKDNDCDGLVDCADPTCTTLACAANGRVCGGTACVCGAGGGAVETSELTCNDGKDNDCDGLVDCAESACNTQACSSTGRVCNGTSCACTGNGGTVELNETLCTDGKDNDCDGLADCAAPSCEGRGCGAGCACLAAGKHETACSGGTDEDADGQIDCVDSDCAGRSCGPGCACSGGVKVELACGNLADDDGDTLVDCLDPNCCGGCPGACESICNDGLDNDGDLLIDCADSTCGGNGCGANGRTCNGSACSCSGNGGIAQATESSCFDGADNDCDGTIDCADSDCVARPCTCEVSCADGVDNDCNGLTDCADSKCLLRACNTTKPAAVCCALGSCRDLAGDKNNCGGCGLVCGGGQNCTSATVGALTSGRCMCSSTCPGGQTCAGGMCGCATSTNCAASQACTQEQGVFTPGFCHYP